MSTNGSAEISVVEGDAWAKEFAGRYQVVSGRAPKSTKEVMVSQAALTRLSKSVGDLITPTDQKKKHFKIVGVLKANYLPRDSAAIYAKTSAISGVKLKNALNGTNFYLADKTKSVDWPSIMKFNLKGIGVLSSTVLLNPPAKEDVPLYQSGYMSTATSNADSSFYSVGLLLPLLLVPVAILTGSAFSFGARRQARTLAVISSLGASRKVLRSITVSNGIWLGLLGGALGSAAGVLVAAWILPQITDGSLSSYPGLHVPYLQLSFLALAGALIGAIVAWLPAIAAAKLDVLSTLRGTREHAAPKRKRGMASLIVILGGTAITALGVIELQAINSSNQTIDETINFIRKIASLQIIFGSIAALIGLIIGSPWILLGISKILHPFGKSARYATRDLVHNSKRFTSVLAAVLATSFIGSAALVGSFIINTYEKNQYRPILENNQLSFDEQWGVDYKYGYTKTQVIKLLAKHNRRLNSSLAGATTVGDVKSSGVISRYVQLGLFGYGFDTVAGKLKLGAEGYSPYVRPNTDYICLFDSRSTSYEAAQNAQRVGDNQTYLALSNQPKFSHCQALTNSFDTLLVGNASDLRLVLGGKVNTQAESTLAAGGAVAFHQGFTNNGKVLLDWYKSGASDILRGNDKKQLKTLKLKRTTELNATVVESPNSDISIMISPETAKALGIPSYPILAIVNYAKPPTTLQQDKLNALVSYSFNLEKGNPVNVEFWAWLILGVTSLFIFISTAISLILAQIESRADLTTLNSIGAKRSFRANVLSLQAFILVFTGTLFGGLLGTALVWSAVSASTAGSIVNMPFELPTTQALLMLFGVPLSLTVLTYLLTPIRMKNRTRLAID